MSVSKLYDSDDSAAFRFTKEEMQLLTLHRAFLLSACAQAQPAAVVDIIVAYWCPAMAALRHTVGMGKRKPDKKKKSKEEETTEVGEEETQGESEETTEESPKKPTKKSKKKSKEEETTEVAEKETPGEGEENTEDEEKAQTEEETLDEEENGDKDDKGEPTVEALRKQVAELQKHVQQLSKGRDRGRARDWMNDEQLKEMQTVKDQHTP